MLAEQENKRRKDENVVRSVSTPFCSRLPTAALATLAGSSSALFSYCDELCECSRGELPCINLLLVMHKPGTNSFSWLRHCKCAGPALEVSHVLCACLLCQTIGDETFQHRNTIPRMFPEGFLALTKIARRPKQMDPTWALRFDENGRQSAEATL